ncbi:TPA: Rrf2 family transcriptional regulator [Serratia liquefaciens]
MRVTIEMPEGVIWMRDAETGEGMASRGYMKDGTQQKIIAVLEEALSQAKGEALCWDDAD